MGTKDGAAGNGAGMHRREILKGAAVAGVGAAAAVAIPGEAAEPVVREDQDEQVKARYRETDHVKRFYFLNSL